MAEASQGQIRAARSLAKRKERVASGLFLAEGPQAVREAAADPGRIVRLFVTAEAAARHRELIGSAQADGVEPLAISDRDLAGLTDTVTPQGLIAVCNALDVDLETALAGDPQLVVCCAQVRDPGNAGTVIRCADAFGADAVVLSEDSVEVYNPKTVRASAGSIFHLPLVTGVPLPETLATCQSRGMQVLAADGSGDLDLDDLASSGDLAKPTVWLMGNEAWGLPAEHAALADRVVRVPIYGAAESLNLSTAAAVCLYATASAQRSVRPTPQSHWPGEARGS